MQKGFEIFFTSILLFIAHLQLNAQKTNYKFQHYTIDNGLSQNLVYSICQDAQGFMWFGTKDGLNRFDGYEFKTYRYDPFDSTSLSGNTITSLFPDRNGHLWIGTSGSGLNTYDSRQDNFIHIDLDKSGKINHQNINGITEDGNGNIWVATDGQGLFRITFHEKNLYSTNYSVTHYIHHENNRESIHSDFVLSVYADSQKNIWVSTVTGGLQTAQIISGNVIFRPVEYEMVIMKQKIMDDKIQFELPVSSNAGKEVLCPPGGSWFEDNAGQLWMGTTSGLLMIDRQRKKILYYNTTGAGNMDGHTLSIHYGPSVNGESPNELWFGMISGLGVFNLKTQTLQFIRNVPQQISSLQLGKILCVYHDKAGNMWMGSSGSGLSKYDPYSNKFPYPLYVSDDKKFTSHDLSVRSFYKFPGRDTLLIGTNEAIYIANPATGHISRITGNIIQIVYSFAGAGGANVWVANNNGLAQFDTKTGLAQSYYPKFLKTPRADNRLFKIFEENKNTLWLLNANSLIRFKVASKSFTFYDFYKDSVNPYSEPAYGDIIQDRKGNLWLGTPEGLFYFDTTTHTFDHYINQPQNTSSLSFNVVRSLLADPSQPEKYLWIGTAGGGLNRLDLTTKKFIHFTSKNGLPNNVVYGILGDNTGKLWLSTNKGISKFDPKTFVFHNYGLNSGLQSNEFNSNAYYKTSDGKLYFGGIRGFNSFYPEKIESNNYVPPVVFTDFRLLNQSILPGDKTGLLQNSISATKSITLAYDQNNFSFEVAALDFAESEENKYQYQLKNLNENWIPLGTGRTITFSNLSPGKYILHVKAANSDGIWNETGTSITIIIKSPWWKTWWAYALYILIAAGILYYLWKYNNKRIELKNKLEFESLHAKKLTELDHIKSRFFANISHEFRTPLTLIISPVQDLLHENIAQKIKEPLYYVQRNAKRLLQLINQLLDLSRLDVGNYEVDTTREDIIPFVKQMVHSFTSMAHQKNIMLETEVDPRLRNELRDEALTFYFDEDIMEKILFNLLSNAFKFTPEGGNIKVSISLAGNNLLELTVEDNGSGISPEKLPYIFDRFYQADNSYKLQHEGTGIGLALVKELVELHQGTITVKSTMNSRTVFICDFPFNNKIISNKSAHKTYATQEVVSTLNTESTGTVCTIDNSRPVVLVVEDQQDVRKYICDKLSETYRVLESKNGMEGLGLAKLHIPDLVVSDVMMPEMDGFALCESLKTNDFTSHIPVILLTARAEDIDKLSGLETGADAYLIKPFNSKELLLRIHNLIEVRNKLRKKFSGKLLVKPSEITVTSQDSQFMQRLLETVEKHLDDDKFSVEALGHEFGMSTSQINRKLKAIINQSPNAFIRSVRMERAMELLKGDNATIAEVAYKTGFSEPAYFSRVFKSYFGYSPSEAEKRNES